MTMRLQILPKYSRNGASSRLRLFQFIPALEAAGHKVDVSSLFDDVYLSNLYQGKTTGWIYVIRRYFARVRLLWSLDRRVPLLIEGELFPWVPYIFERLLLAGRCYLVDYDDAIFHRYDLHRVALVRAILGRKIDRLMAKANLVIVGNSYLADRARAAGAENIELLPTVVNTDRYPLAKMHCSDVPFRVGWIGTPITWSNYGKPVFDLLRKNFADKTVEFVAIGAGTTAYKEGNLTILPWSEDSEAELLGSLSVGLMPLEDTPWARGKCAYKLIQYLACGVPVVASPVGANRDVVISSQNGFFASKPEEWQTSITALLNDLALVRLMGLRGRAQVTERYSVRYAGARLVVLLDGTEGFRGEKQ